MTRSSSFAIPLIALLIGGTLSAQRTWIVDQAAGPGHDFTSVEPAVAAASAGDTVLVRTGTYRESSMEIDKGLSIVGQGSVSLDLGGAMIGIRVHDLPASQSFALRGINLGGIFVVPEFKAERCAGLVTVQDARGITRGVGTEEPMSLEFENCSQAHVCGVFVRGGGRVSFTRTNATMTSSVLEGDINGSFVVADSSVTVDSCTITSGFAIFTATAPIRVTGGELRMTRSSVAVNNFNGNVSAIDAQAAKIVLDPTVQLVPSAGQPSVSGTPTLVSRELSSMVVRSSAGSLDLSLQSRSNALFVTLLSFPTAVLPTPWGALWVDADAHIALHTGVLAQRVDSTQLQTTGIPAGFTAAVQTIVFDGDFEVTNGCGVVFP